VTPKVTQKIKKQKKDSKMFNPDSLRESIKVATNSIDIIYTAVTALIAAILSVWAHVRLGNKESKK
jgi:hypothetical protein